MDIFTHSLSGIAAASAVAAFSSRSLKDKFLLMPASRLLRTRPLRLIPPLVFVFMVCTALFQITHRPAGLAGPASAAGHAEKERQSLVTQRHILGKRLFGIMTALDRKVPFPF